MASRGLIMPLLLAAVVIPCEVLADYGNGDNLGEGLKCVFAVGLFDCNKAKDAANKAAKWAQEYAKSGDWSVNSLHNGQGDAFRHCVWNALMTRKIGADQAKEVADNHEKENSGPKKEKEMDDFNNAYGRTVGKSSKSDLEAKVACYEAAKFGKLKVLSSL